MSSKEFIEDLAVFGGSPVFREPKSTSNLVQPDPEAFFSYAKKSFDAGWLTNNGPLVQEFEARLAEIHESEFCISFCNGLWGLVLAMRCLAISGKTEVVMPSLTYRRMADIAAWVGLIPHFCDADPVTLGVSAKTVAKAINKNTALILVAQPIVNICEMDELVELAREQELPLLIDSVEAAYASYRGKILGSFGSAECYSMHASKFLNGFEAGYVTTNSGEVADRLRKMRAFGFSKQDTIDELGINAKLNEIHAAMALASLDDLEDQILRNRRRYDIYLEGLESIRGIRLVRYSQDEIRTFKNILVELNEDWPLTREETIQILHGEKMVVRPYYYPPLHARKTHYKTIAGDMYNADRLAERYMLLPSGHFLDESDVRSVIDCLAFIERNGGRIKQQLSKKVEK